MRRTVLLAVAGASLLVSAVLVVRQPWRAPSEAPASPPEVSVPSLSHAEVVPHEDEPPGPEANPVAGLDLVHVSTTEGAATAPAAGGTATLTLDADLERTSVGLMNAHHLPEGAIVLMDVATGKVLVYASHVEKGPPRDLCAEASAPSASVFKIVTAAALVEDAHLGPDTKQCYSGGEQRINTPDLVDDPQRDRWCTTLAGAMGRSINTVFARLAKQHLAPSQLETMARRFGYGQPFSFDVPVQPSALRVPTEPLEFARTAAGFWNTTLSPLEAVELSAIVAREGEAVRPSVVEKVIAGDAVAWSAPDGPVTHRVVARETAAQLATMMEHTVSEGTSWRAFHDNKGGAFLPGLTVAGKTGTLTDAETKRYYTWFTGYAPSHPQPGVRQVAVAVLVVNGPSWQVKANVIARDVLRAYFAGHDVTGVTRPSINAIARHHKR
jgi:cell division protein FtsI/penicillin-binding protein 2